MNLEKTNNCGPLERGAVFPPGCGVRQSSAAFRKRDQGAAPLTTRLSAGFTLIEMLVVIGIIAAVLALALPNLRGFREGAQMDAATRQLITDLNIARARAINTRTTVCVIFIPDDIRTLPTTGFSKDEVDEIKRLQGGIYTHYALFSFRKVGDQPGRGTARYLTEWKSLPESTFIAEQKFVAVTDTGVPQFEYADFPFPLSSSTKTVTLPYVAFNYDGRLCRSDGKSLDRPEDIRIPLARGAILYVRDATGGVASFTVQEVPPNNSVLTPNHVVLDWLTGRARLDRAEL